MGSKAAREWAKKVFAHRPVIVHFTRVPAECRKSRCKGYHETFAVYVEENGMVWYVRQYYRHALSMGEPPLMVACDEETLAQLAFRLLCWARKVDPWARYPVMGYRPGSWMEVWF
jgi:hypothetical protein